MVGALAASALDSPASVETFAESPFAGSKPSWCERYHHAHWVGGAIRFTRSARLFHECTPQGDGDSARSCDEAGCSPCGCCAGSPCAKVGDANGNAILMTARDEVGPRRSITVRFALEHRLQLVSSHLGLYAALHPHCHTTVQALLVPDGPDAYHLNLAVLNQYIGGDRARYRACVEHPFAEISPALVGDIRLKEAESYRWTLAVEPAGGDIAVTSLVETAAGTRLAQAEYRFTVPGVWSWLGIADGASRYAFGVQFGPLPNTGAGADPEPSVVLFDVRTDTRRR
jgi:hypothetical protein